MEFQELNLIDQLQRALTDAGYVEPTPIQVQAIPPALEGRDILGCAQTGTGKTAAFALPILNGLGRKNRKAVPYLPKALILAPTRELVIQIGDSFDNYGANLFLRHTLIYGGVSEVRQIRAMQRGSHIVIATPGRLVDLLQQDALHLDELQYFVLDEADRMLDMGFQPDLERIMARLPEQRHSLFFSATIDKNVASLAGGLLRDPLRVDIAPEYPAVETVTQHLCIVENAKKRPLLLRLFHELKPGQTIVFVNKKHTADKLTTWLNKKGFKTDTIHGNKRQSQRERIMGKFRKENIQILVATDVASRGIDIEGITHVFNYDLPFDVEDYIHRIGRTGRAGAEGVAISFCATHEKGTLAEIEKLLGFPIEVMANPGNSHHVDTTKMEDPENVEISSMPDEQNDDIDNNRIAEDQNINDVTDVHIEEIVEPEPTDELSELLEIPMTEGQKNKPEPLAKRSLRKSENPPTSSNTDGQRKMKVRPTPKRARISEGVIVKLSEKGFGFIKTKSGKELYFHMTSVFGRWRFDSLGEGQRVSFKRVKTDKGHVAEGVKGLEEPPERKPRRFGGRDSHGGQGGRRRDGNRGGRRDGDSRGRRGRDGDGDSRGRRGQGAGGDSRGRRGQGAGGDSRGRRGQSAGGASRTRRNSGGARRSRG
ncbi:MAG: DEAD/DEAH box helicase [Planctomycetaceae bacterium]|nr:DEAD/DEAH box helicase [Planctomycetaceae bacterium]